MGEPINANGTEIWTERRGHGPDVLLIAGLGDPAEAWQPQLDGLSDRYRLTAFDNRGAGRTPLPEGLLSASTMADDAAALLRALEILRPRRLLDGQRHRPGAGPSSPRARPQPRPREHLRSPGRPLALATRLLALAGRGRAGRARLLGGLLHGSTRRAHTPTAR